MKDYASIMYGGLCDWLYTEDYENLPVDLACIKSFQEGSRDHFIERFQRFCYSFSLYRNSGLDKKGASKVASVLMEQRVELKSHKDEIPYRVNNIIRETTQREDTDFVVHTSKISYILVPWAYPIFDKFARMGLNLSRFLEHSVESKDVAKSFDSINRPVTDSMSYYGKYTKLLKYEKSRRFLQIQDAIYRLPRRKREQVQNIIGTEGLKLRSVDRMLWCLGATAENGLPEWARTHV